MARRNHRRRSNVGQVRGEPWLSDSKVNGNSIVGLELVSTAHASDRSFPEPFPSSKTAWRERALAPAGKVRDSGDQRERDGRKGSRASGKVPVSGRGFGSFGQTPTRMVL